MEHSYSVKTHLRLDKTRADGTCPIYFFLRFGAVVTKIPSKKYIDPKDWNFNDSKPKLSAKDGRLLAKFLSDKVNGFDTFMLGEQALGKPVTLLVAKSYFSNKTKLDLFDFWEQQVSLWEHKLSPNTIKSYNSVLGILKGFNKKLSFGDLSPLLINKFDEYLAKKRANSLNGRFVKHKCFKSIINQAISNGYIKENPYRFFKIKSTLGIREYLTIEEVKLLINADIPANMSNLYVVRDLFLFSCYTGLRYSDVMNLRVENVKIDKDQPRLEIQVIKTERKLIVPLSQEALDIIKLYTKINSKNLQRLALPTMANPTINKALKDLMEIAGIEKSISFHCARHTFASNHVEIDTSIVHLKNLLGHRNLAQTQLYAKSTMDDLFGSVAKMNDAYKTIKPA
ncbi:site-specific integrase [Mucilaginibacter gossypii]|uniref:site-specific integrase n=1 Tax=Mucilaginibacter gossypii TaxID=551996 RepID=UPI000DCC213F|nr:MULTISPECIES: site-specific integrase [Mucilaginibacter]QTE36107.1 site-specific integrase [Mucilaginibacter gossypii]RAV59979.1 hypothetical protein DIU36_03125 [Mucilaginibacter rubeus]